MNFDSSKFKKKSSVHSDSNSQSKIRTNVRHSSRLNHEPNQISLPNLDNSKSITFVLNTTNENKFTLEKTLILKKTCSAKLNASVNNGSGNNKKIKKTMFTGPDEVN
jgi:hypothetical protein